MRKNKPYRLTDLDVMAINMRNLLVLMRANPPSWCACVPSKKPKCMYHCDVKAAVKSLNKYNRRTGHKLLTMEL